MTDIMNIWLTSSWPEEWSLNYDSGIEVSLNVHMYFIQTNLIILMSDVQRRWHQLKILCRASLWKCLWAAAAVHQVSGTQFYGSILHLLHQRVQKKLDSIKCLILCARYCRGILPNCGPRHLTSPACPHPISALNYQHYPHNCSTIEFVNDVKFGVLCDKIDDGWRSLLLWYLIISVYPTKT